MKRFDLIAGLTALTLAIGMGYVTYSLLNEPSPSSTPKSTRITETRSTPFDHSPLASSSNSTSMELPSPSSKAAHWSARSDAHQAKPMLVSTTAGNEGGSHQEPATTPITPTAPSAAPSGERSSTNLPTLDDIHFHFDRAGFSEEARATLDRHAAWLLKEPGWSVLIQGHTDQEGSVESNLRVGRRRAESVRRYLIDNGVPAERLHIVSLGEFAPICTDDTAECRERNRRVSFAIAPRDTVHAAAHTVSVQESTEQTMQRDLTPSPTNVLSPETVEEEAIATIQSSPSREISESAHTRELGHTAANQHAQAGAFPTESLEAGLSPTSSSDRPLPEVPQSIGHMADHESPQEPEDPTP